MKCLAAKEPIISQKTWWSPQKSEKESIYVSYCLENPSVMIVGNTYIYLCIFFYNCDK